MLKYKNNIYIFTAHEITHAFDDVGIQYDSTGSFRALYDNETVSEFHEASGMILIKLLISYLTNHLIYKNLLFHIVIDA